LQTHVYKLVEWFAARCAGGKLAFLCKVPPEIWYALWMIAMVGVVAGAVLFYSGVTSWVERKLAGHIQARYGPMRVGPHGILQFMADGIKLVLKEDLVPAAAERLLFKAAPYIIIAASLAGFVTIPFTGLNTPYLSVAVVDLNIGVLYVIAMASVVVVALMAAGLGSVNKWSLYGAVRSAAQIIGYEVPMAITLLTMIMITGTLSMDDIVREQAGGIHRWLIFRYGPFTILAFLIYFIAGLAEVNRTPFDLPEAESEIVAGYHTEYSGMRFAFFFMAEYANMLVVACLGTVVFLGGWQSPIGTTILPGYWGLLEGFGWSMVKALALIVVMIWLRWTLPRLRVDQLMRMSWKVLLPVSFVNLMVVAVLMAYSRPCLNWLGFKF
jgi:NADH-quinone oxidoreductase subunit H